MYDLFMVVFASRFEELTVWQKARELNSIIYSTTLNWRDYSLKDQICRAVVSISSNIAEGYERSSRDDFKRFLYIAKGSAAEVRSQLYLALDLKYIHKEQFNELQDKVSFVIILLAKLIKSLTQKS